MAFQKYHNQWFRGNLGGCFLTTFALAIVMAAAFLLLETLVGGLDYAFEVITGNFWLRAGISCLLVIFVLVVIVGFFSVIRVNRKDKSWLRKRDVERVTKTISAFFKRLNTGNPGYAEAMELLDAILIALGSSALSLDDVNKMLRKRKYQTHWAKINYLFARDLDSVGFEKPPDYRPRYLELSWNLKKKRVSRAIAIQ